MIDGRNTLATIVHSSTVELFQTYDIAVAPVISAKSLPKKLDQLLSATAAFSSPAMTGALAMFLPQELATIAKHPGQRSFEPMDWTREMCNQLLGRMKNRLLGCEIDLHTGLPMSVTGTLLDRHRSGKSPEAIFGFRTLRGEVTVTLTGSINYPRIRYTGRNNSAREGEVILF
jgi:hypothetical protein